MKQSVIDYILRESEWCYLTILRGESRTIDLEFPPNVNSNTSLISCWQFETQSYDIGFHLQANNASEDVLQAARYPGDKTIEGKYDIETTDTTSSLALVFDNQYSVWRSKAIKFRATICTEEQFKAAKASLQQERIKQQSAEEAPSSTFSEKDTSSLSLDLEDDDLSDDDGHDEETQKTEKQRLVTSLEDAVSSMVSGFMASPDEPIHEGTVRAFIVALEAILRHGLKKPKNDKVTPEMLQLLSPRAKCACNDSVIEWEERDYWTVLAMTADVLRDDDGITADIRDNYTPLEKAKYVGWGRGRAMLFRLLNANLLGKALENIVKRNSIMTTHYKTKALLRTYEDATRVVALIAALHGLKFKLQVLEDDMEDALPPNLMLQHDKTILPAEDGMYYTTFVGSDSPNSIRCFSDCTPARFLLHAESLVNRHISRSDSLEVPIISSPGSVLAWQFQLRNSSYDIRVGVKFKTEMKMPLQSFQTSSAWVEGMFFIPKGGVTTVVFDNKSSIILGRDISYRAVCVPRKVYQAARVAATDAAYEVAWKNVMEKALPRVLQEKQEQQDQERLIVQQKLDEKATAEEEDTRESRFLGSRSLSRIGGPIAMMMGVSWDAGDDMYDTSECTQCLTPFSLFRRRHRCELCLNIFCLTCSRHFVDVAGKGQNLRSCDPCFVEFMEKETALKRSQLASKSALGDSEVSAEYEALRNDTKYEKYFKMLGVGIPHPAVALKMIQDEIDPNVIEIFRAGPDGKAHQSLKKNNSSATKKEERVKSVVNRPKLRKVHWTALERSENSIWEKQTNRRQAMPAHVTARDIAQLEALFGEKSRAAKKASKTSSSSSKQRGPVCLLDTRRANNINIGLSQFKSIGNSDDIVRAVTTVDWKVLTIERLAALLDVVPTMAEVRRLQGYRGPISDLGSAEQFLLKLSKVKRVSEKVGALLFASQFNSHEKQLCARLSLICDASEEIRSSEKLARMLELALVVGNTMNSSEGDAKGIKLESLAKLSETRSVDRKVTLLDFLVKLASEKGEVDILGFGSEIKSVYKAKRFSNSTCLSQFKVLQRGAEQVKREYERELADDKKRHDETEEKRKADVERLKEKAREKLRLRRIAEEEKKRKAEVSQMYSNDSLKFRDYDYITKAAAADDAAKASLPPTEPKSGRNLLLASIVNQGGKPQGGVTDGNSSRANLLAEIKKGKPSTDSAPCRKNLLAEIRGGKNDDPKKALLAQIKAGKSKGGVNPRANLLSEIRSTNDKPSRANFLGSIAGAAKSRQNRLDSKTDQQSSLLQSDNPDDYVFTPTAYSPESNKFLQALKDIYPRLSKRISELEIKVNRMNRTFDFVASYLAESSASCTSEYIFTIVDQFRIQVGQSSSKMLKKKNFISSSTSMQVGNVVATQYGTATIAAIRTDSDTKSQVYEVVFRCFNARGVLQPSALLLPGEFVKCRPYGVGVLYEIRSRLNSCVVRFSWGYAALNIDQIGPLPAASIPLNNSMQYRQMDKVMTPFGPASVRSFYDKSRGILRVEFSDGTTGFVQYDEVSPFFSSMEPLMVRPTTTTSHSLQDKIRAPAKRDIFDQVMDELDLSSSSEEKEDEANIVVNNNALVDELD